MQKLQIPINETSVAMGRGVLHLLTILPHGQIDLYGIDHVANKLEAELEQHNNDHGEDKWEVFGSISVSTSDTPVITWHCHVSCKLEDVAERELFASLVHLPAKFTSVYQLQDVGVMGSFTAKLPSHWLLKDVTESHLPQSRERR
ncbi:hypothetical protein F441_12231 [Phytophthora nicotianae CJ01A1]|uniref:Uncharacterized protein n=1 Tax=Phytophthora nicotianae CJ01A1 TaxID=1317063 RepID=W2WQL2_PHYNI|nr:hypothetical protein F441_12231 [Phytophthora nicotianae CJ01A1]